MLKNNKIKKSKIGSEVTILRRGKGNGLNILPNTDDQIPNSKMARVSNPGGAISYFRQPFYLKTKNITKKTLI